MIIRAIPTLVLGDLPGHEFHGNQYSSGNTMSTFEHADKLGLSPKKVYSRPDIASIPLTRSELHAVMTSKGFVRTGGYKSSTGESIGYEHPDGRGFTASYPKAQSATGHISGRLPVADITKDAGVNHQPKNSDKPFGEPPQSKGGDPKVEKALAAAKKQAEKTSKAVSRVEAAKAKLQAIRKRMDDGEKGPTSFKVKNLGGAGHVVVGDHGKMLSAFGPFPSWTSNEDNAAIHDSPAQARDAGRRALGK